jgi:hypothetical protein
MTSPAHICHPNLVLAVRILLLRHLLEEIMYAIKLIRQRLDLLTLKMIAFSVLVAALTKRPLSKLRWENSSPAFPSVNG